MDYNKWAKFFGICAQLFPTRKPAQIPGNSLRGEDGLVAGLIFDIKRYAIHDGPGIRTTVFFKGCLLSCWWCHNPEGRFSDMELMIWPNRCIGCRSCVSSCANRAISTRDGSIVTNRDKCKVCGVCVEKCPTNAREIVGKWVSVNELMHEVEKDFPFYEGSGGITASGGEPLIQPVFLDAFLSACKEKDIHTALDTSGYAEKRILMKISKNVDLFLYDLKVMDDEKHRLYTGVSNKRILENLELLDTLDKKIIIRFPLIPHINSNGENIRNMCEFISRLRNVKEVAVLPYHRLGVEKARRLSKEARVFDKPSNRMLNHTLKLIKSLGLKVKIGG